MSEFDTQLAALTAANGSLQTAIGKLNNLMTAADTASILIDGVSKPSVSKQLKTLNAASISAVVDAADSAVATANAATAALTEINADYTAIISGGVSSTVDVGGVQVPTVRKQVADAMAANTTRYAGGVTLPTKKAVVNTGTVSPSVYRNVTPVTGSTYVLEVIAKADTYKYLNIYSGGGGLIFSVTADLSTATFTNDLGGGGSVTPLANGWMLVRFSGVAASTTGANWQVRALNNSKQSTYTGDGASGLYIDSVRLLKDGVSQWSSTDIADAGYTKAGLSVVGADVLNNADAVSITAIPTVVTTAVDAAVNGARTADRFAEGGGTISPTCYRVFTFESGASYELALEAMAGERNLNVHTNAGLIIDVTFDLLNGTVSGTAGLTKTIERIKDGQWRCKISGVATAAGAPNIQLRLKNGSSTTYTGDGASGLWINSVKLTKNGLDSNLLVNSDDFASSAWTKSGLTVTADDADFGGLDIGGTAVSDFADWAGKKLTCLGTSQTAQGQYTTALQAITGAAITNAGISGGSIASGTHYGSLAIYNAIANIPVDSEVVTVELGINDFGTDNSALGTLGDTTTATFYGAIFAAVGAIRARAPNAKVIFFTPFSGAAAHATHRIQRVNSKGLTLQQFQHAVYESAGYCGYHCIDVGRMAGIGYFTPEYMGDNLHLNTAGGQRYAAYVGEQFARLARAGYLA